MTDTGIHRTLRLSAFSSSWDTLPQPLACTWKAFTKELGPHDFTQAKKLGAPMFSPAEYPAGAHRSDVAVVAVHLLVLDLDHVTKEQAYAAVERGVELGLAFLVYTTWRHQEDPWRLRVVIMLNRPVHPDEWAEFWLLGNGLFDHIGDGQCKAVSNAYFGPFAPPPVDVSTLDEDAIPPPDHFFEVFEGEPLDVDSLLLDPPPMLPAPEPENLERLPRERLERFAKAMARKRDDVLAELGDTLLKVCKGESFADHGTRDITIFRLACVLAPRFTDCDPESIAEHFRQSLELMARIAPECPTVENVAYKIARQQKIVREERAAREREERLERRVRIREAFKGARDSPYTLEEIEGFGEHIAKRWIIQRGRAFYLYFDGSYIGPYTDVDVLNAAIRDLSPASSAGVDLFRIGQTGDVQRKTLNAVVSEYGTVAEKVVLDLRGQITRYDELTRTIVEAPCPLRDITPKEHPEISGWLEAFAGDRLEYLKTWIAAVTLLDQRCVALFVTGAPDSGKSLLALGLSRLWTQEQPTTLEEAFASFNDALARCPLCFADEQLPKDWKGFAKNAELRHHIQATVRPFKRKFQPNATLQGATRTIVAANNEGILATPENLSNNDIQAIIDRYLHIPTTVVAAEYLAGVDTTGWVDNDLIAEHALWLRDNHQWVADGRFLIRSNDETLHRSLTTRSGDRSAVCQWLCGYLLDRGKFDRDPGTYLTVRVRKGALLANSKGLVKGWGHYVDNEPCPKTGRLSTALAALSISKIQKLDVARGKRLNYRVIDTENLVAWAEQTGFASRADIETALALSTEDTKTLRVV